MDFKTQLSNYAKLMVHHGLNVQTGQIVNLETECCHRELAYLAALECYRRGAALVDVTFTDPRFLKIRVSESSEKKLEYVPPYVKVKYSNLVKEGACHLKIAGSEDPDILSGEDPKKVNAYRLNFHKAVREFYDEGIGESRVSWCIAAAATPKWAKKVFPRLDLKDAEKRLWKEIFSACRLNSENFLKDWRNHNRTLHRRAARLNELGIHTLHFTGPGTDLSVSLSGMARFKGGTEKGPGGVEFEPNIPSEECFTTPDYRKTTGSVKATRPFMVNGKMIRGLNMEFEGGRIVNFRADEGESTFREYIGSDEGACRLGEVALVGIDSPIYQSGLVFENTLFDENAACHIAVGSGFKFCIDGGSKMDAGELEQIGFNESSVHTDIMISSEEVTLNATAGSGNEVVLIKNGAWQEF